MADACSTCRYISAPTGECRRFPPTLILFGNNNPRGYWPPVAADDWCGEFKTSTQP